MDDTSELWNLIVKNEELQKEINETNVITDILSERVSILEKDNHTLALMYKSLLDNIKLILNEEIDDKEKLIKINKLN
jgi:hypothetical protein